MSGQMGIINASLIQMDPLAGKMTVPVPLTAEPPELPGTAGQPQRTRRIEPEPFLRPTFKSNDSGTMEITDMDRDQFLTWVRKMSADMNEHPAWRMNLKTRKVKDYPAEYLARQINRGVNPETVARLSYIASATYLLLRPDEGVNLQVQPALDFDAMRGSLTVFLNGVGMTYANQGNRTVYQSGFNVVVAGPTMWELFGNDLRPDAGHPVEQAARIVFTEHFGKQPEYFRSPRTQVIAAEDISEAEINSGVIAKTELVADVMGIPMKLVTIKTVGTTTEGSLFDIVVHYPLIGNERRFPIEGRLGMLIAKNRITRQAGGEEI